MDLPLMLIAGLTAPWWMRKPREGWDERFAKAINEQQINEQFAAMANRAGAAQDRRRARVLLHAVSVGEVQALRTLVPLLAEEHGVEVVVSAGTDTGIARARALFEGTAVVVRYPLDFSWAVQRFIDAVMPDAVGLVELELWPQFLGACRRRGIPVAVINGRLSERSFRGYVRARSVVGPMMFGKLAHAAVQDDAYAERFRALSVPSDCVSVTGSMKWDALRVPGDNEDVRDDAARALGADLGLDLSRPIVVAGSTAEDEEELLVSAMSGAGLLEAGVQLVCAPRKPEHFDEAAAAMPGCVRRSSPSRAASSGGQDSGQETGDAVSKSTECLRSPASGLFLLDTIGELSTAYRLADVVVIGRSFGTLHGSDPAEPAALGKPILIGPRFGDFDSAVGALRACGALGVVDRDAGGSGEALGSALARIIGSPSERAAMGAAARACVRERQGASARHAALLMRLAESR